MPRRRLPWQRLPAPEVTRESARDLVNNPPPLPDPFEYGAGPRDRFIASTRWNDPTSIWTKPLIVDQYPAPELFETPEQLAAWQDVLAIDLIGSTQERDDNVGIIGGLLTGLLLGLVPAGVTWLGGKDHADRMLAACIFVLSLAVSTGMALAAKVPHKRLNRLQLVEISYNQLQRELERKSA